MTAKPATRSTKPAKVVVRSQHARKSTMHVTAKTLNKVTEQRRRKKVLIEGQDFFLAQGTYRHQVTRVRDQSGNWVVVDTSKAVQRIVEASRFPHVLVGGVAVECVEPSYGMIGFAQGAVAGDERSADQFMKAVHQNPAFSVESVLAAVKSSAANRRER